MNKICASLIISLLFIGCTDAMKEVRSQDQELRQKFFFKCLNSLPEGPINTKYNDWDEVVSECSSVAYHMSISCIKNCVSEDGRKLH